MLNRLNHDVEPISLSIASRFSVARTATLAIMEHGQEGESLDLRAELRKTRMGVHLAQYIRSEPGSHHRRR